MKAFLEEFKKFALRGNVMDMAVGIIVGAAFTAIVTSLVDDLLSGTSGKSQFLRPQGFGAGSNLCLRQLHNGGYKLPAGGICAFPHNQSNEQNIITWQKGRGSKTYYQGMSVL